jgi:diadenosine tetraphosphate (Ap4A) HIT family hydrolase
VGSTRGAACTFCDLDALRAGAVLLLENDLCLFVNSDDLEGDLLRGSGVIIPKAHRLTVFDLTPAEVTATFDLLRQARPLLDKRYKPDGFNIGWNCYAAGGGDPHAHMHVLLRFADEPKAGQGIRWPLRQADNRRLDPTAPGEGSRRFWSELYT